MKQLRNSTAVITGGASGIGLALAERLGREGVRLMLADIEQSALDAALDSLRRQGFVAEGLTTDVADPAAVDRLADTAEAVFGEVHLLFNNAGVSITGPTWLHTLDDWRWVYGVNIWGVIHGIRSFVPRMLRHGQPAHIINTASLASFNGNGDHAPYCSSKAAVLGISQSLYSEMKALMTNIGVSIVCPGMVATRIHQSWRNRPQGDQPWSDREFANDAFKQGSDAFQGAGISAAEVADLTVAAILQDRFYVFTGNNWQRFLDANLSPLIDGQNPLVNTWGEDRRPASERAAPPWRQAP